MRALVSGQAGLAVVLGDLPEFRPVHGERYVGDRADIGAMLRGASDVEVIETSSLSEVDGVARRLWAIDRALYLLYMLFDNDDRDGDEAEIVDDLLYVLDTGAAHHAFREALLQLDLEPLFIERASALSVNFPDLEPYISSLFPVMKLSGYRSRAHQFAGTSADTQIDAIARSSADIFGDVEGARSYLESARFGSLALTARDLIERGQTSEILDVLNDIRYGWQG